MDVTFTGTTRVAGFGTLYWFHCISVGGREFDIALTRAGNLHEASQLFYCLDKPVRDEAIKTCRTLLDKLKK